MNKKMSKTNKASDTSETEVLSTVISEYNTEITEETSFKKQPKHTAQISPETYKKELGKNIGNFNLRNILIIVSFAILLYWAVTHLSQIGRGIDKVLSIFSPFIIGFAIAFILNMILSPLERLWDKLSKKTEKRKKAVGTTKKLPALGINEKVIKRAVCLVLSAIILVGIVFAIIFMVIPELENAIKTFVDKFPAFIKNLETWTTNLSHFLEGYNISVPELDLNAEKIVKTVTDVVRDKWQIFVDTTFNITSSVFGAVFNVVLAFVFSIYVLVQKEKVSAAANKLIYIFFEKKTADKIHNVASLTNSTFTKFLTGQLTEALVLGCLCFIGMSILRLPYAMVISVLVGVTAIVPIFGALLGTCIGIILILSVNFMSAVWFLIFILLLQQLETHLIYPKVMGKSIGLPGILVIAAVTLGGNMFGFFGVLLGVPVCSVLYCLFLEFMAKKEE